MRGSRRSVAIRRRHVPTPRSCSSTKPEPDRWIVKINPMAAWTRQQTWDYLREHDLPHNPLYDLGYTSIGCAPCTRVHLEGEPERAGRWAGRAKWECGIHEREAAAQRTITLEEA